MGCPAILVYQSNYSVLWTHERHLQWLRNRWQQRPALLPYPSWEIRIYRIWPKSKYICIWLYLKRVLGSRLLHRISHLGVSPTAPGIFPHCLPRPPPVAHRANILDISYGGRWLSLAKSEKRPRASCVVRSRPVGTRQGARRKAVKNNVYF
eukprot:scaffold205757_cov34-Tisochrysis_lutea.AAC.1